MAPTCRVSVFSRQIKKRDRERERERERAREFYKKETFDTKLTTIIQPLPRPMLIQ